MICGNEPYPVQQSVFFAQKVQFYCKWTLSLREGNNYWLRLYNILLYYIITK